MRQCNHKPSFGRSRPVKEGGRSMVSIIIAFQLLEDKTI